MRSHAAYLLRIVLFLVLLVSAPLVAQAQVSEPPEENRDAELVFEQALEAFESGEYGMAERRFRYVVTDYPLHHYTTAALLMRGKALYRNEEFERARLTLRTLLEEYPSSSYVDEARRVLSLVDERIERMQEEAEVVELGVLLPLSEEHARLTQALFNGVRVAVQEHNEAMDGGRPVRMVFRDAGNDSLSIARAMQSFAEEEVDVILGPVFSATAREAAAWAERLRIPLVAPLATDPSVSEGRRYVFQANPSLPVRGEEMARFARLGLRMDSVAVVYDGTNPVSQEMASGFLAGARDNDLFVQYVQRLDGAGAWFDLRRVVPRDSLAGLDAVYLPIGGSRAPRLIGAALTSLGRMDLQIRTLGNAEWHDLPFTGQLSEFGATYTNEFYVADSTALGERFRSRYEMLAGNAPDRLGYAGFDITRYLLEAVANDPDRPLVETIHSASPFQGLGLRIDFEEGNVNRALYFFRYRDGRLDFLR